jgi:predicted metal-dependent peptidase
MLHTAERILMYARTQVIMSYNFMAAYALGMKLEEAADITDTAATDGKKLFYNAKWIQALATQEGRPAVIGVVLHEAMHNALSHLFRRGNRNPELWNQACDYVVNAMIMDLKIRIPRGCLYNPAFNGMTAEAVYAILAKDANLSQSQNGQDSGSGFGSPGDANSSGSGSQDVNNTDPSQNGTGDDSGTDGNDTDGNNTDGNGNDGNGNNNNTNKKNNHGQEWGDHSLWDKASKGADADSVRQKWQRITAVAIASGRGLIPAGIARQLSGTIIPRPKLGDILASYLQPARNDFRWLPPDRNFIYAGLYLPTLRGEEVVDVVIAIDTSGSIDNRALAQFISETKAQMQLHRFNGYVVCCDARVHEWHEIKESAWPDVKFKGGGGTNFAPVFKTIQEKNIRPTAVVFLTDLDGRFPTEKPPYPVLWVVYGPNKSTPPFGRRITLE